MTQISFTWRDIDGMRKFEDAARVLGEKKAYSAYRKAINTTGRKAMTRVKRSLSKQVGASQSHVVKYGGLKRLPAKGYDLQTTIKAEGGYLPFSAFSRTRQVKAGVSAQPWGTRRVFGGSFMIARFGNNAFRNTGRWNKTLGRFNAIERMWGPAIPREMVRNESAMAFRAAAQDLKPEIERVIRITTKGAFS